MIISPLFNLGLAFFAAAALVGMACIAIVNTFAFPRLAQRMGAPTAKHRPPLHISILIPARDEADVIAETIRLLDAQDYPHFEIILLDDHSRDGTGEIARRASKRDARDPRVRVIEGAPLLPGWLGKNWACHQLAQVATGDLLVFTDADVRWLPGALSALAAMLEKTDADLLTVWATQKTITWGERLVVPLIALVILGYLPAPLVHRTANPAFAAANGQCLAFRRKAYFAVGGHVTVRASIIEDISLARAIKRAGLRLRMVDGAGLIGCRMYRNWAEVRDGFAKNILAGYGGRVSLLILATLFHYIIFFLPWFWLLTALFFPSGNLFAVTVGGALSLIGLGLGVRALTAATTRQRIGDALLLPVSVLLMTVIALRAIAWQWGQGGPRWKGRTISTQKG